MNVVSPPAVSCAPSTLSHVLPSLPPFLQILDTCVRSLPDDCRFGVVTVSDRVGLVDLTTPLPHVQFVDLGLGMEAGSGGAGGAGGHKTPRDSWPDASVREGNIFGSHALLCCEKAEQSTWCFSWLLLLYCRFPHHDFLFVFGANRHSGWGCLTRL